ncbi:MAG: DUF2147 domain-containing protein, partial [Spirochaetaceae bacterium]|nr:DUF2147 domain-containing protein [Spirochaetaceae bacterium]
MKKLFGLCIVMVIAGGLGFAADPAEGYWLSIDEKTGKQTAGWHIYAEKGVLYGRILSIYEKSQDEIASKCKETYKGYPEPGRVNQRKVVGSIWVYGLRMKKAGEWSGGSVIDPNDGNIYNCKITFHGADGKKYKEDTLEM